MYLVITLALKTKGNSVFLFLKPIIHPPYAPVRYAPYALPRLGNNTHPLISV